MLKLKIVATSTENLDTSLSQREKCPYSELFWSAFSGIWTEHGEILRIYPHSVQMRENTDQNNSECGDILRSVCHIQSS